MERTPGILAKIEMDTTVWTSRTEAPEKNNYVFDGKVYDTEEQILVRFSQGEVKTSIKYRYRDKVLTVTRKGDYETRMIFDTGSKTSCHYMTSQGEVVMDIKTSAVRVTGAMDVTDKIEESSDKTISLKYSLMAGDDILGRYEMVIRIKKHCDH